MIIDTRAPLASIVTRNAATPRPAGAANYAPAAEAAQKQSDASRSSSAKGTEAERLLKELRDYIDKAPIVALREKILKSMNLTEEKLRRCSRSVLISSIINPDKESGDEDRALQPNHESSRCAESRAT